VVVAEMMLAAVGGPNIALVLFAGRDGTPDPSVKDVLAQRVGGGIFSSGLPHFHAASGRREGGRGRGSEIAVATSGSIV